MLNAWKVAIGSVGFQLVKSLCLVSAKRSHALAFRVSDNSNVEIGSVRYVYHLLHSFSLF
jgi:hypothetical protein